MTKSAKIRRLLAKNLTAVEIAKQLKIPANYVYTVKWLDKKNKKQTPVYKKATFKSPRSRLINDLFQMKKAMDEVEKKAAVGEKPKKLIVQPQYKDPAMKLFTELEAAEKKLDLVNKPPHYTDGGVDTLKFIEAKDLNYRLGNVVKYISRAGKKVGSDPVQDLEKARFYLEREIAARKSA
jgi:hypothetical protein